MDKSLYILTGSTGGLGKTVLDFLEKKDCDLIYPVRKGPSENSPVLNLLQEKDVKQFVTSLNLDGISQLNLVHLVGGFGLDSLTDFDQKLFNKMIDINFTSAMLMIKHLLHIKGDMSLKVILISSKVGVDVSLADQSLSYGLSKSLLGRVQELINAKTTEYNASVDLIVPGIIDTPKNRKEMPEANRANWSSPHEIAERMYKICEMKLENGSRVHNL